MSAYTNLNGQLLLSEEVKLSPDNRSFRYGDGFFTTLRYQREEILLKDLQLARIRHSLEKMEFDRSPLSDSTVLLDQVQQLAALNNHSLARIRLTVFRNNGSLYDNVDNTPCYLIQSWNLDPITNHLNSDGLVAELYTPARKTQDEFSFIKSNSFLPYVMASIFARKHALNDCIILNTSGNIADATIANVFIVEDDVVITSPLSEGPVAGVMRKYLLECMRNEGIRAQERLITTQQLLNASEVFFTNAIFGLRWVSKIGASRYICQTSSYLHKKFVEPLFAL